jgi:Asp-tRNA(Asn)/Glu-tRNA(Gln) amidotransferase A subunit family amidase
LSDYERYDGLGLAGLVKDGTVCASELLGANPGRLRIAFTTKAWSFHEVDSECVDAVEEAAKLCEDLGHHVEEASPEINQVALGKAIWIIMAAQTRALMQFAAVVLGREATSDDVETVTWAYAENRLPTPPSHSLAHFHDVCAATNSYQLLENMRTLRRNPQPPPFLSLRGQRAKLFWTAHGVHRAPISQRFGR